MAEIKKPPDENRVLKISLKKIIRDETKIPIIFDAVIRSNQIIIHTYQFLRLWILDKYHKNLNIPTITGDIVHMAFKALLLDSAGPKPKGQNGIYYDEFIEFYENTYKHLGYTQKLSGRNLSEIISYSITSIITNIENNVKLHFLDHTRRFVNSSFAKQNSQTLESYKGKAKIEMADKLKKELFVVKQDLLNNTRLSDKKYHQWINTHRPNIFSSNDAINQVDVNNDPQSFIKNMIYMNIQLEANDQKLFQFFPLRTSIIPKYIPIDTKSLIELFEENKGEKLKNLAKYQKSIWNSHFKMDHQIFKMNNYSFNYYISTDCYAVSVNFIHNDFLEKNNKKKKAMVEGSKQQKINTNGLSQEAKDKLKADKDALKKAEKKAAKDKYKEEFAKLTKEEKKLLKEKNKKDKYVEFPYIDELSEATLISLLNNCVYIDPGKRDLLTIIDDNDNLFSYSNRQYIHETKRKEYGDYLQNYRDNVGISKIESQLNDFRSKSCSFVKFKEYVSKKNEINAKLFSAYCDDKFRQYKWYSFLNKKRAEANLLNTIEEKYAKKGKKLNIVIGDWGKGKQMRGFISTPMIGMKRVLAERFNVYTIDEFRTSMYHYKTEKKGKNLYITDHNNGSKKIHSVLTFAMENNCLGCINRDVNAVKNIRKLVMCWIYDRARPAIYSRTTVNNPNTLSLLGLTVNMPESTLTSSTFVTIKSKVKSAVKPKQLLPIELVLQQPEQQLETIVLDKCPKNNTGNIDNSSNKSQPKFPTNKPLKKDLTNRKNTRANNSDVKSINQAINVASGNSIWMPE